MNIQRAWRWCAVVVAALALTSTFAIGGAPLVGTAFTYQGELKLAGQPVNSTADFQFSLFAAISGGSALAGPISVNNVTLTEGRFTVSLDFGSSVFNGSPRYLEITVRSPAGSGLFTILSPRQRLAPTPYAIHTRGLHVNAAGDFAGIGRDDQVTASEIFGLYRNTSTFGGMYIETAGGGEPFYGYATNGAAQAYHYLDDDDGRWKLNIGGFERFAIDGSGNVGIKTTAPAFDLDIDDTQAVIRLLSNANQNGSVLELRNLTPPPDMQDTYYGAINFNDVANGTPGQIAYIFEDFGLPVGHAMSFRVLGQERLKITQSNAFLDVGLDVVDPTGTTVASFDRIGADGTVIEIRNDGAVAGTITAFGGTVSYNAFTGSHYAWTDETIEHGALVKLTGVNRIAEHAAQDDEANAEPVYGIAMATTVNDPACLGAYLGPQDSALPISLDNPHLVTAVGNGQMWVTESGGDIQPGDYLISSDVPGCAMKDDPARFPIGHVVARAAQRLDWQSIAPNQAGAKRAKISVFFGSFVRNSEAARLSDEVQALRRLVESQHQQVSALAARLDGANTLTPQKFSANQSRTGESQ